MALNMGDLDRKARVVAGLVLLSMLLWAPQPMWGLIGLAPLATGFIGYCPLYRLLGVSTRPRCRT